MLRVEILRIVVGWRGAAAAGTERERFVNLEIGREENTIGVLHE